MAFPQKEALGKIQFNEVIHCPAWRKLRTAFANLF
jgi:hypothetical protein